MSISQIIQKKFFVQFIKFYLHLSGGCDIITTTTKGFILTYLKGIYPRNDYEKVFLKLRTVVHLILSFSQGHFRKQEAYYET